jgi:hypothetical protein
MTGQAPGLRWSIKYPFLVYIASMADGRCSVTDGASIVEGPEHDQFLFEPVAEVVSGSSVELSFRGEVRFSGHHGMLYVRIADPVVRLGRNGAVLSTLVREATAAQPDRLDLVRCTVPGPPTPVPVSREVVPRHTWLGRDVRLTAAGSDVFGGVYPVGEQFDDVVFTSTADLGVTHPGSTAPSPSPVSERTPA